MQRLIAEWLAERARFVGSLVGLTDEQFNAVTAPGQWTYRVGAKHVLAVEQDSLISTASLLPFLLSFVDLAFVFFVIGCHLFVTRAWTPSR
jgi:hypothetical protein